jgi:hypothetical protein
MLLGVMAFVGAVFYCLFGTFRAFVAGGLLCGAALFGWGYWQMEQAQNTRQNRSVWSANSVHSPCVHAAATTPAQRLGYSSLVHPAVSAFPERVIGSACALSVSKLAQRLLTLRPAHSRCHQFVTRYPKASDPM